MKNLFQGFRDRIRETIAAALRRTPTYAIERSRELPDRLKPRKIYLLGTPEPWSAALLCPCGCQQTIQISLLKNDSPSWRLRLNKRGQPSLSPSVWRKKGCRSHFFLTSGRIIWCPRR